MFGVDVGLTECEYMKINVLYPVRMFKAVLLISIGCEPVPNLASLIFLFYKDISQLCLITTTFSIVQKIGTLLAKLLSFYSLEHC